MRLTRQQAEAIRQAAHQAFGAGTNEMRFFHEIVGARADEIVSKWIDFFVLHKPVKPEHITRRLK